MAEQTCKDLAIWFLDQLPGAKQEDSFRKHVSIAAKLVGTKDKRGKWTIPQVKRALRAFVEENNKMPTHLGVLDSNWFAPDGTTWMEFANTPPPMPAVHDIISLNAWLEEWGDTVPPLYRKKMEDHIRSNMGASIYGRVK